jgi:diadenosine tetraphosphate (Ap4A) HIT family hydrolase
MASEAGPMVNATMRKFGFPETLVREFRHWVVLVRPAQVTLGSLVLCAKSEAESFGALDPQAFAELAEIVPSVEQVLKRFSQYERINYLMLMMVDLNVHFHIFPRYADERSFNATVFADSGWPGPPDLKSGVALDADILHSMQVALKSQFGDAKFKFR